MVCKDSSNVNQAAHRYLHVIMLALIAIPNLAAYRTKLVDGFRPFLASQLEDLLVLLRQRPTELLGVILLKLVTGEIPCF